jgi:hypothetical protein
VKVVFADNLLRRANAARLAILPWNAWRGETKMKVVMTSTAVQLTAMFFLWLILFGVIRI